MGDRRHPRRTDAMLGAICGLGVGVAAWTLATSQVLGDLSFWLFMAGGILACLWQPDLPRFGRTSLRRPFVFSSLVLFGVGAALAAHLAGSLTAVFAGPDRRSGADLVASIYDLASGVLVTLLASLAFLSAGGSGVGDTIVGIVVPMVAFVLMSTVGERVSDALWTETSRASIVEPRVGRAWLRSLAANAVGATLGFVIISFYQSPAALPWLWVLPTIGFLAFLHSSKDERRQASRPGTSAVSRTIARALSRALVPGREPDETAERRRRMAVDLGRRMGVDEFGLEALEMAAWLYELDRLEIPPLLTDRRTARKFGRPSGTEMEEDDILDLIGVPRLTRDILTHRHERWDGTGTPDGLSGAQIPRGARVLCVAGSYASMTVGGPERPVLLPHRALAELRHEAGRIFDPRVIECLAELLREAGERDRPGEPLERDERHSEDGSTVAGDSARLPAVQRELHALYEIGRAVNYRLDLDENLTLILDKLESLVPHASAVVYLKDPEQDVLRARFARGIGAPTIDGMTIVPRACPSGTAFAQRRSTSGHGGRARMPYDPGAWDLDALTESPIHAVLRAALASPLVHAGRCIGTLTLYDRPGRRFSDEERRRVAAVAGHVARAVHNAEPGSPGYLESLTDPLTGLPNGRYLEICSGDLLPSAIGGGTGFGLLAFRVRDLDRVCERSGIAAVERLLGVLARRLASNCSDSEVPVRYGQDLFVVLSPAAVQSEFVRRWDILLRAAEGRPLDLRRGQPHDVRLASAHASCPKDGEDLDELLEVLGTRLGLAFDRGHSVVPFRQVRSVG